MFGATMNVCPNCISNDLISKQFSKTIRDTLGGLNEKLDELTLAGKTNTRYKESLVNEVERLRLLEAFCIEKLRDALSEIYLLAYYYYPCQCPDGECVGHA